MATSWRALLAGGIMMAGTAGTAYAFGLDPGRVLTFHSDRSGACPGLDWHLVIQQNNQLTGMLSWDNMKNVAKVTGTVDDTGRFQLAFHQVDGKVADGSIVGQFPDNNGWLTAKVTNAGCPQQDVQVEWWRSPVNANR